MPEVDTANYNTVTVYAANNGDPTTLDVKVDGTTVASIDNVWTSSRNTVGAFSADISEKANGNVSLTISKAGGKNAYYGNYCYVVFSNKDYGKKTETADSTKPDVGNSGIYSGNDGGEKIAEYSPTSNSRNLMELEEQTVSSNGRLRQQTAGVSA